MKRLFLLLTLTLVAATSVLAFTPDVIGETSKSVNTIESLEVNTAKVHMAALLEFELLESGVCCWRTGPGPTPGSTLFYVDNNDGTTDVYQADAMPLSFYVKKYSGGSSQCIEE